MLTQLLLSVGEVEC